MANKVYVRIKAGKFAVCSDFFAERLRTRTVRLERGYHPMKGLTDEVRDILSEGFVESRKLVFPVGLRFKPNEERDAFWADLRERPDDLFVALSELA